MMAIKTQSNGSASVDSINTTMTPEQQKITLLEQQVREMKRAINILQKQLQQTDKKASVAYNGQHANKMNIHQIKEHLNQGH